MNLESALELKYGMMALGASLKIGELARQAGVSIDALRFYEKQGLIRRASRSRGGFRLYERDVIDQVLFIKKAQAFGFSLEEIRQIRVCGGQGLETCCRQARDLFADKIQEYEMKIRELQTMRRGMKKVLAGWVTGKKPKSKGK